MACELLDVGVTVRDECFVPGLIAGLIESAEVRRDRGDFSHARVGSDRLGAAGTLRGDSTCWLTEPLFAAERALLREFESLRLEINRQGLLGLFDLELHHAWYPPGAGYVRHVDQLRGREQRQVSVILYLNETWERDVGGELRLFTAAGAYRDIEPIAGRLVAFMTAGREHEVLPSRRDRSSISGWFRVRGASRDGM